MPSATTTIAARTFPALGTFATVLVADSDALEEAHDLLAAELDAVDVACSRFRADSEISRVNHARGHPVLVSPLFAKALAVALEAAEVTDGDVDPTCGQSLVRLGYDRDFTQARRHTSPLRQPPLPAGGWRRVRLDLERSEVQVPAGVWLDLGATAKALAADRAAAAIQAATGCGVLVNLGGDLRVAGGPPEGGWRVGIADDAGFDASTASIEPRQVVMINDGGLATSSPLGRARAAVAGPPEVRRAGAGLNRLAVRIGELLAHERETVADLSHRLRTPLTALRIDAESLRDDAEMERLLADVGSVERTVSEIIREARRQRKEGGEVGGGGAPVMCDAARVIAERAAFWWPLAEDQDRRMTVEVANGPVPVFVAADDLATCADILLGNVFAHTPEGVAFAVRLSRRAAGGAWLVVADDGPGFGDADSTRRGQSSRGSTGLGLDIARRIAEASGGTLIIGRSASGGGSVTLGLGSPAGPPEEARRHRRSRLRLRALPRHVSGTASWCSSWRTP